MENWHALSSEKVLENLGSSTDGISEKEASGRLAKFGPNELKKEKGPSFLELFINQLKNPLIYLLLAASIGAFLLGEMFDAILMLAIVVLNAIIGSTQDWRAEKAIEALNAMFERKARVIRAGHERIIPAGELVPGDVIILEAGYDVTADCRILDSADLVVNEASLTGESLPVRKIERLIPESTRLPDRKNMCYAGTFATNGWAKAVVVSTGMETELGHIAGLTQSTPPRKTHIEEVLKVLSKKLAIVFLLISVAVALIGILLGNDIFEMVLTGIALAVAAVPEGLPAVVTLTFALGLQRLAAVNTLVRRLPATETLGAVTYIATDKTGTLTKNEMTVKKIIVDNIEIDVSGSGYDMEGVFSKRPFGLARLLEIGALCNHANVTKEGVTGDPTEAALIVSAAKAGIMQNELVKLHHVLGEISFSEDRKMMSVISRDHSNTVIVNTKGAPENVLSECASYLKDGKQVRMSEKQKGLFQKDAERLAAQGYRVLAFAYRSVLGWKDGDDVENNMVYVGLQAMIDPVRPEAQEAISTATRAGIKITIVTGDHKSTAVAIAKQIGLMKKDSLAIDGAELDSMGDTELDKKIDRIKVFARITPEQKMRVLDTLQKRGEIVAMTGDGVNDAPALKKADIGVAMGIKGTDVARETAQIVLADDNLASIVSGVAEGRSMMLNIKKFVYYLLSCNIAEVLILFFGVILNWPLILLPVQLLWINLATDSITALALGVEPKPKGIMNQKPKDPKEPILPNKVFASLAALALIKTAIVLLLFSFELGNGEEIARTMAFAGLIVLENLNLFNFKSFDKPLHKVSIFDNTYLIVSFLLSIAMTFVIVQTPYLDFMFHLVPLNLMQWLTIFGLGLTIVVAGEIYKNLTYSGMVKIE